MSDLEELVRVYYGKPKEMGSEECLEWRKTHEQKCTGCPNEKKCREAMLDGIERVERILDKWEAEEDEMNG